MEPVEAKDSGGRVDYLFRSHVKSIERMSRVVRAYTRDGKTELEREDLGWFILLEGSHEKLYIGSDEEPTLKPGDEVVVVIRKAT